MRIRSVLLIFSLLLGFNSCKIKRLSERDDLRKAKEEIMETDEAFSDMSKAKGMKKAFLEYIDSEGVLLRPNHLPIVGADAIDYLSQLNDSSFTLTWQPGNAGMSSSKDLGYTYGVYTLKLADTTLEGTYVSIWKKREGKWKFVLDTGNEGLGTRDKGQGNKKIEP